MYISTSFKLYVYIYHLKLCVNIYIYHKYFMCEYIYHKYFTYDWYINIYKMYICTYTPSNHFQCFGPFPISSNFQFLLLSLIVYRQIWLCSTEIAEDVKRGIPSHFSPSWRLILDSPSSCLITMNIMPFSNGRWIPPMWS